MIIHIIEGGVGKCVFFSSLIPKLAEKEKIITLSSYPDIFENNPYIYRSLSRGTPYVWEDFIMKEENNVIFYDPYFHPDFIKRKIHVLDAYSQGLNIPYTKEMLPELYLSNDLKKDAEKFYNETGEFIIIQFNSGQSPIGTNLQQEFKWSGFKREYPIEQAEKLIELIKEKYPKLTIVNYSLPNETTFNLKDTLRLNAPYLFYAALLEKAQTFIGINSSLTHFAAAMKKKGIVLWGGTSPEQWGYDIHTNISGDCESLYCSRPYLRELGDCVGTGGRWSCPTGKCMEIKPETIIKELSSLLDKDKIEKQPDKEKQIPQQRPN